jgi:hypothetical protein
MEKESIVKRLIRTTRSCAMATLAFSLSVHEALAQPAGGGSGVHERIDAGSKALGGIIGVAFVALMVRSLLKKKK